MGSCQKDVAIPFYYFIEKRFHFVDSFVLNKLKHISFLSQFILLNILDFDARLVSQIGMKKLCLGKKRII